jgi:hypothetical protein
MALASMKFMLEGEGKLVVNEYVQALQRRSCHEV